MSKQIFDPIHGFITTTDLMQRIIDTQEFQRLRDLKQLGAVSFVFPSANHTRFEHSIGVSHLAGVMADSLRQKHPEKRITARDIELVRIAGLIHDIGHGPYSHLYDHYIVAKGEPEHEERGCTIFRHMVDRENLTLTAAEVDEIVLMVNPTSEVEDTWKYQIIANKISQIDVDKIDYIQRDSYHIGLKIDGEYQRLLTQCYIKKYRCKDGTTCDVIAWPEKLQFDMFAVFHTRYRLHKQVYNHHTVKAFEYIIAEILKQLKTIPFGKSSDSMVSCHLHEELRSLQMQLTKRMVPKLIGERVEKQRHVHTCESEPGYPRDVLNIIIDRIELGFAHSSKGNPLNHIYYFKHPDDSTAFRVKASETSFCIPEMHYESIVRMYTRNKIVTKADKKLWETFCQKNSLN